MIPSVLRIDHIDRAWMIGLETNRLTPPSRVLCQGKQTRTVDRGSGTARESTSHDRHERREGSSGVDLRLFLREMPRPIGLASRQPNKGLSRREG